MPSFSYQLYSSRNFPPIEDTFKMLSSLGYEGVEGFGALLLDIKGDPEKFRAQLDEQNLVMKSSHIGLDFLKEDPQGAIDLCKKLGIENAYGPFLQVDDRPNTSEGWVEFSRSLSELGKPLVDAGIGFGWHNHDFEFATLADGQIPMEIIMDEATSLEMEFDVAWCVRGDKDPLDFIKKYGPRITAAHIKDLAREGEYPDEDGWADVGYGYVDWPTIYDELKAGGTKLFIMEHDNPSDHERFARRSLESAMKF